MSRFHLLQERQLGFPITCKQRLKQLIYYCSQAELSRVPKEIGFIFTNLNYAASREEILSLMLVGGQAGIYPTGRLNTSSPSLYRQIEILQPTFFAAVPSFWCDLYNMYNSELQQISSEGDQIPPVNSLHAKYYQMFGHRCVSLSTGSAHTPIHVSQFMKTILSRPPAETISIPRLIYEGYGTMECGGISNNGKFLDSVLWKVATDDGVISTFNGRTLRGELYVNSSRMISEYFQDTSLTRDRYTSDGYFKTGDLVELTCHCGAINERREQMEIESFEGCFCEKLGGPHVCIIGRVGTTIKLRNGEYFSPEVIEGMLIECPSILDLFVYLDMQYGYPVTVVVYSEVIIDLSEDEKKNLIMEDIKLFGCKKYDISVVPSPRNCLKFFPFHNGIESSYFEWEKMSFQNL